MINLNIMEETIEIEDHPEDFPFYIGWKFPPSFDHHSGRVAMVNGLRDIKESLMILMRTRVGERIVEQAYGCDLTPLAFQQLDLNLKTLMMNNIKQAIAEHESRVEVLEVQLRTPSYEEGMVEIYIRYQVKQLDIVETLQYNYHPILNT